jgi:lysine decarboxylase/arginine decarboxylase
VRGERTFPLTALIADDALGAVTASGRSARALAGELRARGVSVVEASSAADAESVILSEPGLQAVLLDWSLAGGDGTHAAVRGLLARIRSRNARLPVFLMAERDDAPMLSVEVMSQADELVWTLEDTADFVAGRVLAAMRRYRERVLPPFTAALLEFARTYEYSWHTPGHTGGTAFLKSPAGRAFFEHFGERLLRSDLSVSVDGLGSLLDHAGPIGESERYAARVFGAQRSYSVTGGTSAANRIVLTACLAPGEVALCDRNCHTSVQQGLALSGAVPVWLRPTRNHLGLIGPVPPQRLGAEALREARAAHPLAAGAERASHAVLTNSTYDGLCCDAVRAAALLGAACDRVHFDEAWFAHARFHPLYRGRHAMHGEPGASPPGGPTLFATTSTHKLLAALSQASFIHVRDGRRAIEHQRFNEAFRMHATTSPQYAVIASNEVAAAMMEGPGGAVLTGEAIAEAVAFRKAVARLRAELAARGEWFFDTWGPEEVADPATGGRVPFAQAPEALLVSDPACWTLRPGDAWHGFAGLEGDWCLLDPIKVSVVCPGVGRDGGHEPLGIPAMLLTAWLEARAIVPEKTADYTVLFLFSIGVTKGKWGTLVNALLDFKEAFDRDAPLADELPALVAAHPGAYEGLGLRGLAERMHAQVSESRRLALQEAAFAELPRPVLSPREAHSRLVRGEVEAVPAGRLAGRVLAVGLVPYPPGIPLLAPGESAGSADGAHLAYLAALRDWDRRFPGFSHEVHGQWEEGGDAMTYCVTGVAG